MRFVKFSLAAVVGFLLAGSAFAADSYTIDPANTSVGFSIRHMSISNVKGKFTDLAGVIQYNPSDATQTAVNLTIKASSINTDVQKRDDHLRSDAFFDVVKYPEITFISKRVEKKNNGFVVVGDLTMHGVTKEIEIPFTVSGPIKTPHGDRIGVEGELMLNRQDYGVAYDKTGVTVGNDVKIEFEVEAIKK